MLIFPKPTLLPRASLLSGLVVMTSVVSGLAFGVMAASAVVLAGHYRDQRRG